MREIRALVVDDEPLARRGIRQLLAPYRDFVVAGECGNGRQALRALATERPDLVFLDIRMPGLDGLEVVRLHGPQNMPLTVFVTAHDEFAVGAFEAQALDYLVKPLSETRFRATIERVREKLRVHDAVALAARLTALLGRPPAGTATSRTPPGGRIAVPTADGTLLLDQAEIDWIEADDDCAKIRASGKRHRVRESLTALEARLDPARFARIHRSTIVRLDHVRELRAAGDDGEATLVLRDGTALPVSRRRLPEVRALLRAPGRSA